ncbi:hypothetical protein GKZ90_0007470 [Flavobacterium sp. MC2016-06]|uniref:hypothetical protein n=1 Tax=Flavobacterium sp. MC2016-06 TaxID=2676308 RepID=UPI0012BAD5A7|nr:hypothetical protein [Flavobacterium sp. MC2016-06]MBU3858133.1 hypothetical protein [Flavobacterium sp. MC2016-06]
MDFRFLCIVLCFILMVAIVFFIRRKKPVNNKADFIWVVILAILFISISRRITRKVELERNDIYGEYVIDTTQFYGKQAVWQYNHYRFEIKRNNKIVFHLTEKNKIIKTYTGTVQFLEEYKKPRIKTHFENPKYHIVIENPTLYRKIWSFYYVFNSSKFGNVFFKKGKWKPIDK